MVANCYWLATDGARLKTTSTVCTSEKMPTSKSHFACVVLAYLAFLRHRRVGCICKFQAFARLVWNAPLSHINHTYTHVLVFARASYTTLIYAHLRERTQAGSHTMHTMHTQHNHTMHTNSSHFAQIITTLSRRLVWKGKLASAASLQCPHVSSSESASAVVGCTLPYWANSIQSEAVCE